MSDIFRKMQPGNPLRLSAGAYNAFVDAAAAFRKHVGKAVLPPPTVPKDRANVLWVQNDSGGDLTECNVAGIGDVLFTPAQAGNDTFKYQQIFSAVTPTAADHVGRFVILIDDIKAGDIGRALLGGIAYVPIDVLDADQMLAEVKDADATMLQSSSLGSAQILWKESGTGTKWAVIRFPFRVASDPISFDRTCRIREALPTTPDPDTNAITNAQGGDAEVLLLHAEFPVDTTLRALRSLSLSLGHSLSFEMSARSVTYPYVHTGYLWVRWITEEFNPDTVAWNTRPPTDAGSEMGGSAMAWINDTVVVLDQAGNISTPHNIIAPGEANSGFLAGPWTVEDQPGVTVYGVEVRLEPQSAGEPTFTSWSCMVTCEKTRSKMLL